MLRLKMLGASAVFCLLVALPLNAIRRPDVPSSRNGSGPFSTCPDSNATPFFAELDGTVTPPAGCNKTGEPHDPNKPNPPALYPNLSVTLTGSGFTVTITPALWDLGFAATNTKHTVFAVQFSGASGMTLQSLLIGSKLNNAGYVLCDTSEPGAMPSVFCVSDPFVLYSDGSAEAALEPAAISQADNTTTRWDFSNFAVGGSLGLIVDGFPTAFSKIDAFPISNALTAASFASSNFLAVVSPGPGSKPLFAGGLFDGGATLKVAPAALNDLFSNAINIKKVPFKSFVNTSGTNPTELTVAPNPPPDPPVAGSMVDPQSDPVPKDPAVLDAGTPCSGSWPPGANVFRSVWYTFTPTISENYAASTAGSRYDTGVYVFTGSPSSPTTVACNDDAPTNTAVVPESSYANFAATAGTTYYIMVSEVQPPSGTDSTGTIGLAAPLATDATLDFSLAVGSPVVLSPNTVLHFSTSQTVKTSSSLPITATNTTSKNVTVSEAAIINSGAQDFSQTNDCTTLAPGASCTVTVVFTPLVAKSVIATLVLHISGGVNPTGITLTGTGVPPNN
jgi:hypothetical protein